MLERYRLCPKWRRVLREALDSLGRDEVIQAAGRAQRQLLLARARKAQCRAESRTLKILGIGDSIGECRGQVGSAAQKTGLCCLLAIRERRRRERRGRCRNTRGLYGRAHPCRLS